MAGGILSTNKAAGQYFNWLTGFLFLTILNSCSSTSTQSALSERCNFVIKIDVAKLLIEVGQDVDFSAWLNPSADVHKFDFSHTGIDPKGVVFIFKESDPQLQHTYFSAIPLSDSAAFKSWFAAFLNLQFSEPARQQFLKSSGGYINVFVYDDFALISYSIFESEARVAEELLKKQLKKISEKSAVECPESFKAILKEPAAVHVWCKPEVFKSIALFQWIPTEYFDHWIIQPKFLKGRLEFDLTSAFSNDHPPPFNMDWFQKIETSNRFFKKQSLGNPLILLMANLNLANITKDMEKWVQNNYGALVEMGQDTAVLKHTFTGELACEVLQANHLGGVIPQFALSLGVRNMDFLESFVNNLLFLGAIEKIKSNTYLIPGLTGYQLQVADSSLVLEFIEFNDRSAEIKQNDLIKNLQPSKIYLQADLKRTYRLIDKYINPMWQKWANYFPHLQLEVHEQSSRQHMMIHLNIFTAAPDENAFFTILRLLQLQTVNS